jgi:RimJ/RimL family protein N-acetyltransferase
MKQAAFASMSLYLLPITPSASGLPEAAQTDPVLDIIHGTRQLYARKGYQPPWIGYLAFEQRVVVGACGFAAPPASGEVEIAYTTLPDHRGRGIASRMAAELLRQTQAALGSNQFIAHTLPEEGPSTSILRKLGFICVGQIAHPEDGPVWKWRKPR